MRFIMNYFNVNNYLEMRESLHKESKNFEEIEINISRKCNRTCIICPHSNVEYQKFLNNFNNLFMDKLIFKRIVDEISSIKDFSFNIDIIGSGEPTLHPNFLEFIEYILKKTTNYIRITTNGDKLLKDFDFRKKLYNLIENQNVILNISVYDSKQVEKYTRLKTLENVVIKDMFLDKSINLKDKHINNRAGSVDNSYITRVNKTTCNYPFYALYVDIDGDIQYCPHDWEKRLVFANIKDMSLLKAWSIETKHRSLMLAHKRSEIYPCYKCSVDGCKIGNKKRKMFE